MPSRSESERDFALKASIRQVLWAQGYSTRLDVLLAYDFHPQGAGRTGKAGLTDLDVLGVQLFPGFRSHTTIADCKTSKDRVPERLFWLAGVAKFFGSDTSLLVRSQPIPQHAVPLARSLGLTLVGPDDLTILANTYPLAPSVDCSQDWRQFFTPELLSETLQRLARFPIRDVDVYRDTRYWMDAPHVRLQRVVGALAEIAKDGNRGTIAHLVFADFVWLYVLAIWQACEALVADGVSRTERSLHLYLSGNEEGLRNLQQVQRSFETLVRRAHIDAPLSIQPPYFQELLEVIVRCLRRPDATAKLARRAEWLIVGQIVGGLGFPAWPRTDDEAMAEKLLGDIARFLVRASKLDESFLERYLELLTNRDKAEPVELVPANGDAASENSKPQPEQAQTEGE